MKINPSLREPEDSETELRLPQVMRILSSVEEPAANVSIACFVLFEIVLDNEAFDESTGEERDWAAFESDGVFDFAVFTVDGTDSVVNEIGNGDAGFEAFFVVPVEVEFFDVWVDVLFV